MKLTAPQRACLAYYLWLETREGPKPKWSQDTRVTNTLLDRQLLGNVGTRRQARLRRQEDHGHGRGQSRDGGVMSESHCRCECPHAEPCPSCSAEPCEACRKFMASFEVARDGEMVRAELLQALKSRSCEPV
jgi:hypothetical protein